MLLTGASEESEFSSVNSFDRSEIVSRFFGDCSLDSIVSLLCRFVLLEVESVESVLNEWHLSSTGVETDGSVVFVSLEISEIRKSNS